MTYNAFRRCIAIILAIAFIMPLIASCAFGGGDETTNGTNNNQEAPETTVITESNGSVDLSYTNLGDGTCGIRGLGMCSDIDIVIPEAIDGLTVKSILPEAFMNSSITSIFFPSSISSIGDNAFRNCLGLTSVTLPSSISSLGHDVFSGCTELRSIDFEGNTNEFNAFIASNVVRGWYSVGTVNCCDGEILLNDLSGSVGLAYDKVCIMV